jgi:hypothetical protein
MKRHVINISVRVDTEEPIEQTAARVGQALGCTFAEVEYQKNRHGHVAYVLGFRLRLEWAQGIGRKAVTRLTGIINDKDVRNAPDGAGSAENVDADISPYIVDLLTMRTGLRWYQPTAEDVLFENRVSAAYDDWLGGVGSEWTQSYE